MSMVINLVEDHNIYLCEGGPVYNGGVQPTPITYLTQWKIVGNSEVHTLPYPDGVVLPNGYKRCEYLTFDGYSYINTGIKTENDIGYDLRCKITDSKLLIGARYDTANSGFIVGFFQNKQVAVAYGGATTVNFPTTGNYIDGIHHIILDSVKFQIDDEVLDISSLRNTADKVLDIYLGTWNNNGIRDGRMWVSDIYDTIIYNTQGELWHGIPCLDANNVPCFYDIISQTAFYNQGIGNFTYKLYPQPTEIWSCGEYNATDGKYHIFIQPQGGSIADIALTEPLRMVNAVADTIEFPSGTDGKALVTRNLASAILNNLSWRFSTYSQFLLNNDLPIKPVSTGNTAANILIEGFTTYGYDDLNNNKYHYGCCLSFGSNVLGLYDDSFYEGTQITQEFTNYISGKKIIYELANPTTELVDAPQIEEAESYTMVISQGGKAVEWSSFITNSE